MHLNLKIDHHACWYLKNVKPLTTVLIGLPTYFSQPTYNFYVTRIGLLIYLYWFISILIIIIILW